MTSFRLQSTQVKYYSYFKQLLHSLTLLIRKALYEGSAEPSAIAKLLPGIATPLLYTPTHYLDCKSSGGFHGDLRKLLSELIAKRM